MYVFEMATALAGHLLGVQPFDQPDVERAKVLAREAMGGTRSPLARDDAGELQDWIDETPDDHCLVVLAFVDPRDFRQAARLARRLAERRSLWYGAAPGPRYLHASGQLHKARPDRFSFVNLVDQPAWDCPIPERTFTLGKLLRAQADGDVAALREAGARVFASLWPDVRDTCGANDAR